MSTSHHLVTTERDSYEPCPAPSTLVGYLRARALRQHDTPAYIYLSDGETEEATLNYGELDGRARTIASLLQTAAGVRSRCDA